MVGLAEILHAALGVGLHGRSARRPVRRADLAVLIRELERLHVAQRLVHRATHGQVVHGDLAENALGIDDKQATMPRL